MLNKPIPTIPFPSIHEYPLIPEDEPILSLTDNGFLCESQYYYQGIPGALEDCYTRESVIERLSKAQEYLPKGFQFKIYDAYRPICVQQRLWNHYRAKVKMENPNASEEELDKKTGFFVSKPSYDEMNPSLHNTGGSIDLTIIDENGKELNMGTGFDDFSNQAWTNHFEEYEDCEEVRNNRRILYNAMIKAGFTNLPSEWWHYDYGTKFWSYFTGQPAKYSGALSLDLGKSFPLT